MAEATPDPGPDTPPVVSEPAAAPAQETVEEKRAARQGWYRSPSGGVAHADGPDQQRAFTGRGWVEIDEEQARQVIAERATLAVDRADTKDTFDEAAVKAAVREESTGTARRRRKA